MKLQTIELMIFCISLLIGIFNTFLIVRLYESEPMKVYGENLLDGNSTGVDIPGCAYLVQTRGRTGKEVMLTDAHEQVHEMIYQNETCSGQSCREHFCSKK